VSSVRNLIVGLVWAVLFAAAGFMTLRSGSNAWLSALYTLATVALLAAPVAARFSRGAAGAFWFGFTVVGWGFWLLGLGVSPVTDPGADGSTTSLQTNDYLLTTAAIKSVRNTLKPPANLAEVGHYGTDLAAGYLLLTVCFAFAGGFVALALQRLVPYGPSRPPGDSESQAAPRKRTVRVLVAVLLSAVSTLLLIGVVRYLDPPHPSYFPDSVSDENTGLYSGVLKAARKSFVAMREPSLWELSRKNPSVSAYRFLWVDWSGHPIAVRVTRREDETTLILVVLDGIHGEKPGSVAVRKVLRVSPAQWNDLTQRLEKAGFWSMSTRLDEEETRRYRAGQLVLEGTRSGRYHAAQRPDDGGKSEFSALGRHMLDLTGFGPEAAGGGYAGSGFR
jgi:hypothetical protein